MNRRGFLASILAAASAPAIVRASSIMRMRPVLAGPSVGDTIWIAEDATTPFTVVGVRSFVGSHLYDEIMRDCVKRLAMAIDEDVLSAIQAASIIRPVGDELRIVRPH